MAKSEETRFLRGEIGIDGEAIDEEQDLGQIDRGRAIDQLVANRAYLGREMLTWLLFRSNAGGPIAVVEGEGVKLLFTGSAVLRGVAGEATELQVRGHLSAYSDVLRAALDRGLLIHTARIRIEHGDQHFELTMDAEVFELKSAQIPKVLGKEDDDRINERLWLAERLGILVDALWDEFLEHRRSRRWRSKIVPEMKAWFSA